MLTFIVHIRKDSDERVKNLNIVLPYYRSILPDSKFIFIEDSNLKEFSYLKDLPDTSYINVEESDNSYCKSKCYNKGLMLCDTEYACFLDIDCVVSINNVNKALDTISDNTIAIGYNGISIYFNQTVKNKIEKVDHSLYDFLDSFIEKSKLHLNYKTPDYLVGNTKAVGGCLVGKTKTFKEINGFNPNIIGWGYEDNEIIHRGNRLGYNMVYINTDKPLLFHLPHTTTEYDKSCHPFYQNNHREFLKTSNMTKSELESYIKTW